VLRSAWIYGTGGKNFLSRLPELVRAGDPIKAIADQRSSPTFAPDLAREIVGLAGSGRFGTYHVVNEGSCSYAEFVRHALDVLRAGGLLEEVSHVDLPRPAPRPANTSLVGRAWTAAGFARLRPWQRAAEAFLGTAGAT
jgi:dTDP-4-dehydrorhamnose reductase